MDSPIFALKYSYGNENTKRSQCAGPQQTKTMPSESTYIHVCGPMCRRSHVSLFLAKPRVRYAFIFFVCPSQSACVGLRVCVGCVCLCESVRSRLCAFFLSSIFLVENFCANRKAVQVFFHASAVRRSTHSHHRTEKSFLAFSHMDTIYMH